MIIKKWIWKIKCKNSKYLCKFFNSKFKKIIIWFVYIGFLMGNW